MPTLAAVEPRWMTSVSEPETPTPGEWSIIACIRPRFHDTRITVTAPSGDDVLILTDPATERDDALAAGERARVIAQALIDAAPLAWGQAQYWDLFLAGAGVVPVSAQKAYDAATKQAWEQVKEHFQGEAIPGQNWKAPYARFAQWFEDASRAPGQYASADL